jgi:hypothetical protein
LGRILLSRRVPVWGRGGISIQAEPLTHLKTLPKLDRLDSQGCGLSFEDIDDFQVARPSIKYGSAQRRVRWFSLGHKTGDLFQGDALDSEKL